jgi:outer membrane protein assembly factor BamB
MPRSFLPVVWIIAWAAWLAGISGPAFAQQNAWPQFLGPERKGISKETALLDVWPAGGPKVVWRAKGGVGMSGLAITRGRLLTLVQSEGKQWLAAYDAKTGHALWSVPLAPQYRNAMGDGPRGTPTIAGDVVATFTGEGILTLSKFADGAPVWSHDTVKELGGKPAEYGMACSPLVVGEQVVVTVGAPGATVVAYDLTTGKLAWKAGDDPAGYSSPTVLNVGGKEQIVAFTGGSVLGLAPRTGTLLWRHPYETNYECNIAVPLEFKGQVFVSAGENHGSALLGLKPSGEKLNASEAWTSQGVDSVLRSEWQTPILLDGHFYGMDNVGGAGPITHLTCIEAATGARRWQVPRFGKGNLIAADGKLFLSTMKGELVVVRASPQEYTEIGRAQVIGTTRQAPSLVDGMLYLRDDKEIICIDVRKP